MYCSSCGKNIPDGSTICPECGKSTMIQLWEMALADNHQQQ